ncbi:TadE/TadG family type IV pilus assembly protein [Rhizobium leguminosarum]|uniref:TadE/TadG family type IV pilus assembly protein n=1 Tax=Rhizobium leguminosarum TaxID=384 RepID=UPI0014425F3A|nr:TadE/TadG family type IV pilus assembly protein [Rhizobium leguminosarum]MBY5813687.1 pilus assembly protein [Rhizobium leguminosarum]NKK99855.1 pilus assembly protein [Rhizobium leguminosarum bv. viciae]
MKRFAKSILHTADGAAAVEFSLLVFPFFVIIFGILDVALMFFVDGSLDSALHMAARDVRTGRASIEKWNLASFKQEVCGGMALAFDCGNSLLIVTKVMDDFSAVTFTSAVSNRALSINESFAGGAPGDYVMIQAFLPWPSWLSSMGVDTAHLADGRYVLSASALFRNEPYEN